MAHKAPEGLIEKLDQLVIRFDELTHQLSQADVIQNRDKFTKLSRDRNELEPIVEKFKEYKSSLDNYQGALAMFSENDPELRSMAQVEVKELEPRLDEISAELQFLLLPKDPNDEKNVMLELRAGVGGDEAGLFAYDLYRAYQKFCEKKGFRVEVVSLAQNEAGGLKEIIANISGERVFSTLKYESGVHRVQRVPKTETQGRVHTSTVTVAILPEAEEVDLKIEDKDLRIDVFRAGGHGGQSVNTTDSAVRITHLPTGEVVVCQDEKSQLKNKNKAMKILRSRLYEKLQEEKRQKEAADRKSQVGMGFRNERIRTYNYPQGRVTDHRIGLTVHNLSTVMEGDFFEINEAISNHYKLEALKANTATA